MDETGGPDEGEAEATEGGDSGGPDTEPEGGPVGGGSSDPEEVVGSDPGEGEDTAGVADVEFGAIDAVDGESAACPHCGADLPSGAGFCPHCDTDLTTDGSAIDLDELDGLLDEETRAQLFDEDDGFMQIDDRGRRRASRPVRILSGLAVSIPLAPLVTFLVGSAVDLTILTAPAVFLVGWLMPAAYLTRAHLPAAAFGRSLHLIAICTALFPLALSVSGGARNPAGDLTLEFGTITAIALVVASVAFALGTFVRRQATRRVSGERRAFESLREE